MYIISIRSHNLIRSETFWDIIKLVGKYLIIFCLFYRYDDNFFYGNISHIIRTEGCNYFWNFWLHFNSNIDSLWMLKNKRQKRIIMWRQTGACLLKKCHVTSCWAYEHTAILNIIFRSYAFDLCDFNKLDKSIWFIHHIL